MTAPSRRRRPPRAPWYDSPWRILGTAVGTALTLAVALLVVALVVVPRVSGGAALTVLSGSMEPGLAPGDVAVTRGIDPGAVCAEVGVGTVVTYLPRPDDPALITHRVIGKTIGTFDDGTACRLITQGDANTAVDDPVSPEQVRGVLLYGVPRLGWVRPWVAEHPAVVVALVALAVVGYGVAASVRPPRTRAVLLPEPGSGPVPGSAPVPGPVPAGDRALDRDPRERDLRERDLRERDLRERDLRERELVLRERELAVRERELAQRADPRPSAPSEA
jgi:signal peptidase